MIINSKLNMYQQVAIRMCGQGGLCDDHIRAMRLPNNEFKKQHFEALVFLINRQHLRPEQAIAEITDLNMDQVAAINQCYQGGLRGDHLRAMQLPYNMFDNNFTGRHFSALVFLINEQHLRPAQAIAKINNLTGIEVSQVLKDAKEDHLEFMKNAKILVEASKSKGSSLFRLPPELHREILEYGSDDRSSEHFQKPKP